MGNINQIFHMPQILAKMKSGEIEDRELEYLNEWLNQSKENKLLLDKIMNEENRSRREELLKQIDLEKAWEKYSMKIERKKNLLFLRICKYAAAILLPITILTLVFLPERLHEKERAEELAQIVPGSKNARLILDNGENLYLDNSKAFEFKEKDGTTIKKENDLLTYQKSEEHKKPDKRPNNVLETPRGGEYNLVLADGSKVYLNSMSRLTFPVAFDGSTREVHLKGEACFMVEKDTLHPFIVNVNGVKIQVLGTTFNVDAYEDEDEIMTTLVEGTIKIHMDEYPEKKIFLEPDDQLLYDTKTKNIKINKVNANDYIQWIHGIYTFNNESLVGIMQALSRWYDFTYSFEQQELENLRFGGGLNKYESIEPILEIIESTDKVKVKINGKNIIFSNK